MSNLVRDHVVGIMRRAGRRPKFHMAEETEFAAALTRLLGQECGLVIFHAGKALASPDNLSKTKQSRKELCEKIADVRELLGALMRLLRIDDVEVEEARLRKLESKGGFEQRIILDEA